MSITCECRSASNNAIERSRRGLQPKDVKPPFKYDRRDFGHWNLQSEFLPCRNLRRRCQRVFDHTVVINRGRILGHAKQVQRVVAMIRGSTGIVIRAGDFQTRHFVKTNQIFRISIMQVRFADLLLEQGVFKLLKQRRLVVAQFRLDIVLGVEKHFTVGFPNPVTLHPFPLRPGICRSFVLFFVLRNLFR